MLILSGNETLKPGMKVAYTSGRKGDNSSSPRWGGAWGKIPGIIKEIITPPSSKSTSILVVFPAINGANMFTMTDLTFIEHLEEEEQAEEQGGIDDLYVTNFGEEWQEDEFEMGEIDEIGKSERKLMKGTLVAYTSGRHGDTERNPLWGGKRGEKVGRVKSMDATGQLCVDFPELGVSNIYLPEDLSTIEEVIKKRDELEQEEPEEPTRRVKGIFNI